MDLPFPVQQTVQGLKKVGTDTLTGMLIGGAIFGIASVFITGRRIWKGQPVIPARRSKSTKK